MNTFSIQAENLTRRFGTAAVFKNISFSVATGSSMAITGPNGSGKSTLLQIIAGIQPRTSGSITRTMNGGLLSIDEFLALTGFTGPQVNPYDMLTAAENLRFTIKGPDSAERINTMLQYFDLYRHRNKPVKHFSSGMKQRLKLIHAFINNPEIILLDEPGSNLDRKGKDKLFAKLDELKSNRILILASNEDDEINLCGAKVELGKQNI